MGLPVDLLLTTGEERGESSAAVFRTRKTYKWIFSFDRLGDRCRVLPVRMLSLNESSAWRWVPHWRWHLLVHQRARHLGCCGITRLRDVLITTLTGPTAICLCLGSRSP